MLDKADPTPELDSVDPETGEVLPETETAIEPDDIDGPEVAPDLEFTTPPHIDLETLSGDIRDAMLSRFRLLTKPWEMLSESSQYDVVNGLELAAKDLVRKVVRAMTTYDFPHVAVKLGDVAIKAGDKGIEAKITAMNISENREVLGDAVGEWVMILMVDSDRFMAERAAPAITPDQADLPLGGEAPDGCGADGVEDAEVAPDEDTAGEEGGDA